MGMCLKLLAYSNNEKDHDEDTSTRSQRATSFDLFSNSSFSLFVIKSPSSMPLTTLSAKINKLNLKYYPKAAKSIGTWELGSLKFFCAGRKFSVQFLVRNRFHQFTIHRCEFKIFPCQNGFNCAFSSNWMSLNLDISISAAIRVPA